MKNIRERSRWFTNTINVNACYTCTYWIMKKGSDSSFQLSLIIIKIISIISFPHDKQVETTHIRSMGSTWHKDNFP